MSPLDKAIQHVGNAANLARALKISPQAIDQWRKNGIPAKRVAQIEKVTGVPRHALRPDIYSVAR